MKKTYTLITEVTDIEWDAPKSVKNDLPSSFVFHIGEVEGVDFDCEEDIHEWVSDKLSDETGCCHFGFCFNKFNTEIAIQPQKYGLQEYTEFIENTVRPME